MNRRGFLGDVLSILVGCFAVIVVALVVLLLISKTNTAFQSSDIPQEGKDIMQNGQDKLPSAFDVFLITMLFGLPVAAAVFAYFLDVSGVLFWAVIIISVVYIIVAAAIANGWEAMTTDTTIGGIAATVPMTTYTMNHYPLYALYVIVMVCGGLFLKMRGAYA